MMSTPSQSLVRAPHNLSGPSITSTPSPASISTAQVISEGLENAGRLIDTHLKEDAAFVELSGQLRIATHTLANTSGHADIDYPSLSTILPALGTLPSLGPHHHTPLPPELLQEFQNLQCNCSMGLMPEVCRAWLTIDNTLYMWNYMDGKDLAYFDGLDQVIMSVGLTRPRDGVFQDHIQYLLCLTTAVEVVILGVSFTTTPLDQFAEMHLQPEPLFHLPSDNVGMMCVLGTPEGRMFLGGKDGVLYEVTYQVKEGWFSKKCQLVNHSISRLSFLIPSFLSFTEEDPLMQLIVDSSRQILYSRSNTNTITVYDLGRDGLGMCKVATMSMETIALKGSHALRTPDKSLFKPLISISIIPTSDSSTLHLIAVSQAGFRFYFTTTPNGVIGRPSLLALVHVRLPPGFSPSSAAHRPGNTVHQSFYRRGTLVMSSSQSPDKDVLWIIDSDMFPFQSSLLESHVNVSLEGRTWAIAESILPGELEAISSTSPLPPCVVTQHAHPARQFVLVSTQGSYLINKLRPVDQLQYLLEVSKGGSTDAIKAFFKLHRETQACAMCLILATGSNQQVSQWATEAFFKFGGEPQMTTPPHADPSGHHQMGGGSPMQTSPVVGSGIHGQYHGNTSSQTPSTQYGTGTPKQYGMQTPNFGMTLGWAVMGPEVQLSGKHNGLCRYLARLLKPLWNEHIIISKHPTRTQPQDQFYSKYSFEELTVFLEQVYNFKAFFERNPQLLSPPLERSTTESPSNVTNHLFRHGNVTMDSPTNPEQSNMQKQRTGAYIQEYDSTRFLYQLVIRCFECLSLWKLICEYQLHPTVCGLSKEMRERLKLITFRFLILGGKELTSALISALLARHAGDAGLSSTISARLRETTPSLFSEDDAVINKADELVAIAAASQTKYEQLNNLRASLKYYCQVTLQLNLQAVANSYQSLSYFEGIVELCLCTAHYKDPQNLGLHFYKSGQPSDDAGGQRAFLDRQECYANITNALGNLLAKDRTPASPHTLPTQPGPPPSPQPEQDQDTPRKQFDEMVSMALRSEDELFHVSLYSWFISVHLLDKLVEIKTPFIETYLKYTAVIQQNNRVLLDLLWRYYEKNTNYGAAARILDQLAHREGSELSLDERIEYMSRAVMSAKSSNLPTSSSREGDVLHELEEKMEVARIQLSILDALKKCSLNRDISVAITQLNSELMDITTLYEHFAAEFDLAECKLAIVHCAGHYDPTLIDSLWRDIVINEMRSSASSSAKIQFENVRSKLISLGCVYGRSERFFPMEYLVMMLEKHACEGGWAVNGVHRMLNEIGISLISIFKIYNKIFKSKDSSWESKGHPLHLLNAINSLLLDYVQMPTLVSVYERPSFNAFILDAISHYLIELQTLSPSTTSLNDVTTNLRTIQNNIQKLSVSTH